MTPESTGLFVESSTMHPTTPSTNSANSMSHRHSLSLRKARQLSRVFTEFSLLEPFASRRNADRPSTPPPHAEPTVHDNIHASAISLETKSHDESAPSPTTSPISESRMPEIKGVTTSHNNTPILNSEAVEGPPQHFTPSTSRIRPTKLPDNLPPSSSSRHISRLTKKQRKSLDLRRADGSPVIARSTSLRISDMRRPATHSHWRDSSPDIRELPVLPETYNRYLEVKRARKMTQLFGQELPPELIRVLDKGRKSEHVRHRKDSSSSVESSHSILETDDESSFEADVMDKSSPELLHEDFQKRRRRIMKLTQFFGVSHTEIASSVVNAKPDERMSPSLDAEPQEDARTAMVDYGVGVKIVSRRRWGSGEDMRDVELRDAITRLRGLKSN